MKHWEWATALAVSVLFALAIGVENGEWNQGVYLLDGLRRADPDYLRGDWFTWEVEQNHVPFSYLVAVMAKAGLLELGLTAGALIQSIGFAVALFIAARVLYERPFPGWATALALLAAFRVPGLEGYGLIFPQLEAAVISAVAMALGLALLLGGRLLAAGFLFGISGLFHAHYAVLLIPVLAGTIVGEERGSRGRSALRLWIPFLIVAAPTLARAVQFALMPSPEGWHEMSLLRFPYHLLPASWPPHRWGVFFGTAAMGLAGWILLKPRLDRRFVAAMATIAILVVGSIPPGWSGSVPIVTTLWPWRLAPYLIIASITTFSFGLWGAFRVVGVSRPRLCLAASAATIGSIIVTYNLTRMQLSVVLVAWSMPLVAALAADRRVPRRARSLLWTSVVVLAFVPTLRTSSRQWHSRIQPTHDSMKPLYEWIVSETPPGSLFLVPPTRMEDFRLVTQRPIVWDWDSLAWHPEGKQAWFDRLLDVTGVDGPVEDVAAEAGYAAMDCRRIERLRAKYGPRYAVFKGPVELPGDCAALVYADTLYRVFRLEPGPGPGGGSP